MVERRVLPLKWQAHLLCDYVGVEDTTHKSMEELEDDAIVMQMAGMVDRGVMVMAKCTVMAF